MTMGASYVTGEPDIATVGATEWQGWFNSLDQASKIAWASTMTGSAVGSYASALGIARNYAAAGGAVLPEHVVGAYAQSQIPLHIARQNMQRLLLWGGLAAVGFWFVTRRRRR